MSRFGICLFVGCFVLSCFYTSGIICAGEAETEAAFSSVKIQLYGYIKLDGAYDTSRTNEGNFARWVETEEVNEDDDQFNLTARQTRFGANLIGPEIKGVKTSGKLEIDFYGGGSENKNLPYMRHAYLQLDWLDSDFSILAGQAFDLISPLAPSTINYAVAWWAGDIQYRRPQLRLSKGTGKAKSSRFLAEFALVRTIGDASGDGAEPYTPGDTGEDAGFPSIQSRFAFYFPGAAQKKAMIGVSGHWGQEEWDRDATGETVENLDTWSASLDILLPLTQNVTIKTSAWTGINLDAYLGGIGQGVNKSTLEEIASSGGWFYIDFAASKWKTAVGATLDDPDDEDLNDGQRTKNMSIFGNFLYHLNKHVSSGFEVSYWQTDYKELQEGTNLRLQGTMIYKF